jgi:hypothetical protein
MPYLANYWMRIFSSVSREQYKEQRLCSGMSHGIVWQIGSNVLKEHGVSIFRV